MNTTTQAIGIGSGTKKPIVLQRNKNGVLTVSYLVTNTKN